MNYTFNNSSIVSVNSGTIVLNVSGKTRTFTNAKLVSAINGEMVLDLPYTPPTNGAYRTIHLTKGIQRTFISNTSNESLSTYHITQYSAGIKSTGAWGAEGVYRNATPEEIQELDDQLAAEGKYWNPDTMQIEKLGWKPKHGDRYYCIDIASAFFVICHVWRNDTVDSDYYDQNNCFKTKKEAEAKLEQIKKLLLEV
jgi:hypothetical protein